MLQPVKQSTVIVRRTDVSARTLYTPLAQLTSRSARGISPCRHAEQSSSSSPAISRNGQADRPPTTLRMHTYIHNRMLAVHWKFSTATPISDFRMGCLVGQQDAPVWYELSSSCFIWTSPRSRGGVQKQQLRGCFCVQLSFRQTVGC
jgi:hypothetical protein